MEETKAKKRTPLQKSSMRYATIESDAKPELRDMIAKIFLDVCDSLPRTTNLEQIFYSLRERIDGRFGEGIWVCGVHVSLAISHKWAKGTYVSAHICGFYMFAYLEAGFDLDQILMYADVSSIYIDDEYCFETTDTEKLDALAAIQKCLPEWREQTGEKAAFSLCRLISKTLGENPFTGWWEVSIFQCRAVFRTRKMLKEMCIQVKDCGFFFVLSK